MISKWGSFDVHDFICAIIAWTQCLKICIKCLLIFFFFYTCAGVRIYQSIRITKRSERYPFGLYNETFMWFPYTVPGGLSVSTSIIRVSFSASLNLLLICSIWQLIKLVDALASHIQMYWLETSDDSFKLSSKVSAFLVNANFDPDLINSWCHVPIRKLETQVLLSLACFFAYNQGKLNGIFFYLMAPPMLLLLNSECCNPAPLKLHLSLQNFLCIFFLFSV